MKLFFDIHIVTVYFLRRKIMKKKSIVAVAMLVLAAILLPGCNKKDDNLVKVHLNEVAHSIFYAPQYVAIEQGYFKDEGLDVTLVNGLGADKTMTALLAGDADIGFMGSEASIYVYNEGKEDYVINFAQLTQRAGNFLVSRDKNENFSWDNVKGKNYRWRQTRWYASNGFGIYPEEKWY
jgi:NitT/TauT family transport system substrate-binding protein